MTKIFKSEHQPIPTLIKNTDEAITDSDKANMLASQLTMLHCNQCTNVTSSLRQHFKHCKLHEATDGEFVCGFIDCRRTYKRKSSLQRHYIRRHHLSVMDEIHEIFDRSNVMDKFTCSDLDCRTELTTLYNLTKHMKDHIRDGLTILCPFDNCKLTYQNVRSFSSHISRYHYRVMDTVNILNKNLKMYQPIQKVGEYKLRWIVFYAILGSVTLTPTFITAANSTFDENNNYILDFGNVNSEINLCSKMGRWILKKNGSAVDSAITTMICNGIMTPSALGIGGGFLMTIYDRKNKQAHFLNAKEKAPLAAHKNMFKDNDKEPSKVGSLAIGVPGEVAGYWEAHQKFGKLAWFDLFEPNIQLCKIQSSSDRNIRPQFCDTIRTIAEKGANEFYNGTIGKKLIEDLNKLGSIMTIEDLKNYRVKWTDPIVNDFLNGTKLFTSNLPGSGGLLVLMLNIFDEFKFTRESIIGQENKIKTHHRIIETWKYAYAIRSQMGDPDFTDMTDLMKNITSKDFARMIKDKIDDQRTFNDPSHYGGGENLVEDHGTSHMSIIAPNGDAVAVTSSLNGHFGSGEISNQTGIILNNAMDDFSIPTVINTYSLPGVNKNNEVEGGKRPLSSMVPSIITTSNGDVRMVIGAAGGTQITTSVSYVIARHLFMAEPIREAIIAPRIHHQLYPMELSCGQMISYKIYYGLKKMGHVMGPDATSSSVIALVQINGTVIDHFFS
ncbi:glutathione hydrolase 1 proenzyme-like [Aphidius gifuensis]|uniref:glutathione hydrolase 1 proenzyme-like n=1 Tax=Aphidius gifuensis TaxID=684658 RepID=UPI001CDC9BD9|nr:glutathione hydrolase 1 proenzyme-like [Aphidius gifuensis]